MASYLEALVDGSCRNEDAKLAKVYIECVDVVSILFKQFIILDGLMASSKSWQKM